MAPTENELRRKIVEIGRLAHPDALDADGGEYVEVFLERPLEHQDSDLHGRARDCGYQPLTARRSASGIASSAKPRIGAPRPFETSAIFFGSS